VDKPIPPCCCMGGPTPPRVGRKSLARWYSGWGWIGPVAVLYEVKHFGRRQSAPSVWALRSRADIPWVFRVARIACNSGENSCP